MVLSACVRPPLMPLEPDTPEVKELESLILVFYSRVSNRRFNSISTFHDPALREFFKTPEAFADYYADLAQDLTVAHFDYNRPTSFQILGLEVLESESRESRGASRGSEQSPAAVLEDRHGARGPVGTRRWSLVDYSRKALTKPVLEPPVERLSGFDPAYRGSDGITVYEVLPRSRLGLKSEYKAPHIG